MDGNWTYLFTDVEGSTRLWAECEEKMRRAMARHDQIATEILGRHGSQLHKERGEGDSLFVTFADPIAAIDASIELLAALEAEPWDLPRPIRIRAAIHKGTGEFRDGDYYGSNVNFCARVRGLGHGGQILLSSEVIDEVRSSRSVLDLGLHRMKDIDGPRRIFQVIDPRLRLDFPPLRGIAEVPGNLPAYATRFLPRVDLDTASLSSTTDHRLITMAGPAGCGKTRLVVDAAQREREGYPAGAWFVDCSNARSRPDLEFALRSAIDLPEMGDMRLTEQLRRHWPRDPVLLIFDNLEQCIDDAAHLIEELLVAVSPARIWTTSRESLELVGEKVVRVDPLPTPTRSEPSSSVARNPAVQLFFDRAGLVESDAAPDLISLDRVRSIVTELDGIPLAIELAAARLRTLDLAEIEQQLRNRMELLSRDRRTAVDRQRTIENAIAWSFDLLDSREQNDLVYLAVVPGPIDAGVAKAILAREDALHTVGALADASLLQSAGDSKYRFLRTIREYANRQFEGAHHAQVPRARMCDHFEHRCSEVEARYVSGEQAEALADLAEHYENIRESVEMALTIRERELDPMCTVVRVLVRHWRAKGLFSEGRALAGSLSKATGRTTVRGKLDLAIAVGTLAWRQGHLPEADQWFQTALRLSKNLGDAEAESQARNNLGLVAQDRGDFATAENHHREALRLREDLGLRDGEAASLNNLGLVAWQRGQLEAALEYFSRCLEIRQVLPGRLGRANTLTNLALVQIDLGQYALAQSSTSEAITIFEELGDSGALLQARFVNADAQYALGQLESARAEYRSLLAEYDELGDDWSAIACRLSLADVDWQSGELDDAGVAYCAVIETASRLAQWGHVAHACLPLAMMNLQSDNLTRAHAYCALHDEIARDETLHASWHCPVQRNELPVWDAPSGTRQALLDVVLALEEGAPGPIVRA